MYTEGTGFYSCKECHKTESLLNHTATTHKERERLGEQRNVGESSCNCGDGTGQMAQPLMFMMMMMMFSKYSNIKFHENPSSASHVWTDRQTDMTKLKVAFHNF
jgi:hypothetical protein